MRTTVSLDDDVAAAVEEIRRSKHVGLSEAVNELARAGMAASPERRVFRQRSADLGIRIDVSNVGEALDTLDGPGAR